MVSIFLIFFLSATVFFIVKIIKGVKGKGDKDNEYVLAAYAMAGIVSALGTFIFVIWVSTLINRVVTEYTIDNKIAMYEEENVSIEESIDVMVKSCMDFEASTFDDLKDKDVIYLVSLCPELKSDTFVQEQIKIYIANNNNIKELKKEKINLSKSKWKLYFGR